MKPRNTICLWFDKDAHEAARFYAVTFPDSKVTAVHEAAADYPGGKKGDVLTVEFSVLGITCLGLDGGPAFRHIEAFPSRSRRTIRKRPTVTGTRLSAMAAGKRVRLVQGRWGLSWQITPRALTDALAAGGDEAKRFRHDDDDQEDRHRIHRSGPARLTRTRRIFVLDHAPLALESGVRLRSKGPLAVGFHGGSAAPLGNPIHISRSRNQRYLHTGSGNSSKMSLALRSGLVSGNFVRQARMGEGSPAAGAEGVNGTPSERTPSTFPKGARLGSKNIP